MIDPANVKVAFDAFKLALEILKRLPKDGAKRSQSDPFLEYDPRELRGHYASEKPVAPALTYTLVCDLLGIGDRRSIAPHCNQIRLKPMKKQFTLAAGRGPWAKTAAAGFAALWESGRIKDDETLIRVADVAVKANELILTVQKATYFDQAHSNLILDFDGGNQTNYPRLRTQLNLEFGTYLPDLADRRLANTLGAALLVFYHSAGGWVPYLVKRAMKIGVFPGGVHCSASGAVKWPAVQADMSLDHITAHLLDEAHEEIGLLPDDLQDLQPVAFCREMTRGGKPQLFYCARTYLSRKELGARRAHAGRVAEKQKLWTEVERDRWYKSADVVMTPSRLRYGMETWGVTLEAAAALYFGTHYLKKLAR